MNSLGERGKRTSSLREWYALVGVRSTLHWLLIRIRLVLGAGEPKVWRVRPRAVQHALTVRLRDSSDMSVFRQIFSQDEYSSLRNLENVSMVLDLGANVGYSSAYFLSCFPNCRVVAAEPDERNAAICRTNLKAYGDRVLFVQGAVWSEPTALCLSKGTFRDGREWATQVLKPLDGSIGEVQAWDVGTLIDMAGSSEVDLLKIDIERAELAVFGDTARTWLHRVRNICIELHGSDCQEAFFNALADFDYELEHSGELTICRNLHAKTLAG
jgi:FkbM family methyltransferase